MEERGGNTGLASGYKFCLILGSWYLSIFTCRLFLSSTLLKLEPWRVPLLSNNAHDRIVLRELDVNFFNIEVDLPEMYRCESRNK